MDENKLTYGVVKFPVTKVQFPGGATGSVS